MVNILVIKFTSIISTNTTIIIIKHTTIHHSCT